MTFKIRLKQDDKGAEHESKHLLMSDMEMRCSVALNLNCSFETRGERQMWFSFL